MVIDYNVRELEKALDDFYHATGTNINLLDADFEPVELRRRPSNNFCTLIQSTPAGKEKCLLSDQCLLKRCTESRQFELHTCHAGLMDSAVPLIYNDSVIGYIILGQMRTDTEFEEISKHIADLPICASAAEECYSSLPFCSSDQIKSVANIAVMLTEYILFKNMLKPQYNRHLETAIKYIRENIQDELSISDICRNTNVSKTVLYKVFHEQLNCTVGEYINTQRIHKAKELLKNSDKSIEEISHSVGFSSHTFFCKVFKKITGTTPLKYRKS